jgi:hypothetical protein
MANIYDTVVAALRAHWAMHENKQPQKLLLQPSSTTRSRSCAGSAGKA